MSSNWKPEGKVILYGKKEYLAWRRYVEREAKILDVWGFFTTSDMLKEPVLQDYVVFVDGPLAESREMSSHEKEMLRRRQAVEGGSDSITNKKDDGTDSSSANAGKVTSRVVDSGMSLLSYQVGVQKYEKYRGEVKEARRLLILLVSTSIAEDLGNKSLLSDPHAALKHIEQTYGSDENLCDMLLAEIERFKLSSCGSMEEFLDKHADYGRSLERLGMLDYNSEDMICNILSGLPPDYDSFKESWQWFLLFDSSDPYDIYNFSDLLRDKEESIRQKENNNPSRGKRRRH